MKIQIEQLEISFDALGKNTSAEKYRAFAEISNTLQRIDEGTQGGHHGTDHAFIEYRINDAYTIRQVLPSDHANGFLQLEENSASMQEAYEKQLADDDEYYEKREREYQAQLNS